MNLAISNYWIVFPIQPFEPHENHTEPPNNEILGVSTTEYYWEPFIWYEIYSLLICMQQRYILITTVKVDVKSITCLISLIDMYKYIL